MTSEQDVLMSLYSKFSETTIAKALELCANLDEINKSDNMPQNICENCFKDLVQAFFFVKRAKTSDEILGRLFKFKSQVLLPRIDDEEPKLVPISTIIEAKDEDEFVPNEAPYPLEEPIYANNVDMDDQNMDPLVIINEIRPSIQSPMIEDDQSKTENMDTIPDSYSPFDDMGNDFDDDMHSNHEDTKIVLEELPIINTTEVDNSMYEAHLKEIKPDGIVCCSYKCYQMFPSEDDLLAHCGDRHKSKRYKKEKKNLVCQKCFASFSNKSSLEAHIETSKSEVYLECDICRLRFTGSKRKNMIIHIKNHYDNGVLKEPKKPVGDGNKFEANIKEINVDGVFCCGLRCYAVLPDEATFQEHAKDAHSRKNYNDNRPTDMKCERCFTVFLDSKQHKKHIDEVRNVKKVLECEICKLRFLIHSRKYLRKHIKGHFDSNGQLKELNPPQPVYNIEDLKALYGFLCCGQGCQQTFDTEETLLKHAHKQHLSTKIYNEHKAGTKTLECEVCFRRFDNIRSLKHHQRRKYIEQHTATPCEHCGLKLKRMELETHMAKHKDEKQYICDYCGRGFYNKIKVRAHVKTHVALPIHECNVCGAKFKQITYLNTHMFRHKNIFPFSCKLCSVKCRTKFDLSEHQRVHTGGFNFNFWFTFK